MSEDNNLGPDGPILRRKTTEEAPASAPKAQIKAAPKAPEISFRGAAPVAKTLSSPNPVQAPPVKTMAFDTSGSTDDFAAMLEASGSMQIACRRSPVIWNKYAGAPKACSVRKLLTFGVCKEIPGCGAVGFDSSTAGLCGSASAGLQAASAADGGKSP